MSMITPAPDVTLHTLDNPQQAEEVVVKAAPEGPGLPARPLETEARRQKEQLVDEDVDFANIFGAAPAADQPFDAVPPFSGAQGRSIIEAELGLDLDRTFSVISPEPVASASIGQVYKATLRNSGEEVAVSSAMHCWT